MKKKKIAEKSIPMRIPIKLLKKIEKRGNGDFRAGLFHMDTVCEVVENDPVIILQKGLENYGNLIKAFASENHYQHYLNSNLPAMLNKFNKTGLVDNRILNSRLEKPISKFLENDKEEKNDILPSD